MHRQTLPSIGALMVVDDHSEHRALAVSMCRALGTGAVHEASDGQEALDVLATLPQPPELLLIDLEMPGMDGVELIQQLHARHLRIPFLICSSHEQPLLDAVEGMAVTLGLPVVGSLRKPIALEALRSSLQRGALLQEAPVQQPMPVAAITRPMLAAALAGDPAHGRIGVHFQPKVDMRSGGVRGVEVLARWQHPTLGYIRPDAFVALAEREGLIHSLTLAVTEQALAQIGAWNASGLRLSVAINLSPLVLDKAELVGQLTALVERHEVATEQIVLEVTETAVVSYLGTALGVLARLRLKGFGLSLDDYGTGFSSMQQLARIPFTELKIDRSFVHGAAKYKNLCVILQSALDMSRRLGLVTVAEGIETEDDWRLLQRFGCSIGQGYLIAKPMPASALPDWIALHAQRLPSLQSDAEPSFATTLAAPLALLPQVTGAPALPMHSL